MAAVYRWADRGLVPIQPPEAAAALLDESDAASDEAADEVDAADDDEALDADESPAGLTNFSVIRSDSPISRKGCASVPSGTRSDGGSVQTPFG